MAEPTPERRRELLNELTQEAIEADSYGEPAPEMRPSTPERQDLRERLVALLVARHTNGLCPPDGPCEACDCFDPQHRSERDEADAVIAVLAGDAGDIPKRMAEAIRTAAHDCDDDCKRDGCHPNVIVTSMSGDKIFAVEGTPEALAEAMMPVRSEHAAHMAARIAVAEAKVAEYENALNWQTSCLACSKVLDSSIAEHERAIEEHDRADKAEAQVAALQRELAEAEATNAKACSDCRTQAEQAERELASRDAAIERARRMAQVWIDIRPTFPSPEGGALAHAGQRILTALSSRPDDPEEIRRLAESTETET